MRESQKQPFLLSFNRFLRVDQTDLLYQRD